MKLYGCQSAAGMQCRRSKEPTKCQSRSYCTRDRAKEHGSASGLRRPRSCVAHPSQTVCPHGTKAQMRSSASCRPRKAKAGRRATLSLSLSSLCLQAHRTGAGQLRTEEAHLGAAERRSLRRCGSRRPSGRDHRAVGCAAGRAGSHDVAWPDTA